MKIWFDFFFDVLTIDSWASAEGRGVAPDPWVYAQFVFLVQKTSDFSKFMVCPNEQGEVGGGQFFAILYGRLLWTAPYRKMRLPHPINWPISQWKSGFYW